MVRSLCRATPHAAPMSPSRLGYAGGQGISRRGRRHRQQQRFAAGGSDLPVTIYRLKVAEQFKGTFDAPKGETRDRAAECSVSPDCGAGR